MKTEIHTAGQYLAHLMRPAQQVILQLQEYTLIKIMLAGALVVCQAFINDHLQAFMVLVTLVVIDTISGVVAAVKNKEFSSSRFRAGIIKLLMYSLLVAAFHLIGYILAPLEAATLDKVAILYLAATEAFSIVENVQRITGVPLPTWVRELLKSFGKKDDEKGA